MKDINGFSPAQDRKNFPIWLDSEKHISLAIHNSIYLWKGSLIYYLRKIFRKSNTSYVRVNIRR